MPGQVIIKGYQIGYRFTKDGPYTDLPMVLVSEHQGFPWAAELEAKRLVSVLREDFAGVIRTEWRIIECWE